MPEKQGKKQGSAFEQAKFKKGQSGNPGGRPKGSVSLTTILRQRLTKGDAKTIVNNLLALALRVPEQRQFRKTDCDGEEFYYEAYDPSEVKLYQFAVQTLLDRIDGKVPQPLASDGDHPLVFTLDLAANSDAGNNPLPTPPALS